MGGGLTARAAPVNPPLRVSGPAIGPCRQVGAIAGWWVRSAGRDFAGAGGFFRGMRSLLRSQSDRVARAPETEMGRRAGACQHSSMMSIATQAPMGQDAAASSHVVHETGSTTSAMATRQASAATSIAA